jgi:hypothetical protein
MQVYNLLQQQFHLGEAGFQVLDIPNNDKNLPGLDGGPPFTSYAALASKPSHSQSAEGVKQSANHWCAYLILPRTHHIEHRAVGAALPALSRAVTCARINVITAPPYSSVSEHAAHIELRSSSNVWGENKFNDTHFFFSYTCRKRAERVAFSHDDHRCRRRRRTTLSWCLRKRWE